MSGPGYSLKRPIKTALHQAVLDCRIHQVRLLVEKHGGDVDARDMFGRTPLMLACLLDNEDYGYRMAKLFMKAGAFLNMRDNMNRTALHYACMKGREKMVKMLLLEDNIDIGIQDNDGHNALMHATLSGNPVIVENIIGFMVKFGLPIDERNAMGYTPFLLACKFGHFVSAHYLLTKGGAQPDIRDTECNLTAKEWIKKCTKDLVVPRSSPTAMRRSHTMPEMALGPLSFVRETTMYLEQGQEPLSRHISTAPHRYTTRSLGSALRLPDLFKNMGMEDEKVQNTIAGRNARHVVLQEIEEAMKNRKRFKKPDSDISVSRIPTTNFQSRAVSTVTRSTQSSAKLRSIITKESRKSRHIVPDLMMLFKLYSDQFEGNEDRMMTTQDNFPHVRFDTATETVVESPMKMPDISVRMPSPTLGSDVAAPI